MRLNEIIVEQQLDERPMGFLSKGIQKAKSFVPGRTGRKAKGALKVGDIANKLSDEFDEYLGGVPGGEATPEIVLAFLKKKGYPTAGAEKAMKDPTISQQLGKAAGNVAKGIGKVGKGISDVAKGAVAGAKNANAQKTTKQQAPTKIPSQTDQPQANTNLAAGRDFSGVDALSEGLSGLQLDKIFMAAAQDMHMAQQGGMDVQGGTGKVDDPAQSGAGGFMSGFKSGMASTKGGTDSDTPTDADATGVVIPQNIESQINQLNPQQKKELLGML